LRDGFGHRRLRAGVYTAGQIDARWTQAIEADFTSRLRQNIDNPPAARENIEQILSGPGSGHASSAIAARIMRGHRIEEGTFRGSW
jgi:hypothetical protein